VSRRTRVALLAVVPGVVIGCLNLSASADPLCYSASTTGTVPGNHTVGPVCVTQYPFGVACFNESAGLAPTAGASVHFCTP
jgi:hypothetical protein